MIVTVNKLGIRYLKYNFALLSDFGVVIIVVLRLRPVRNLSEIFLLIKISTNLIIGQSIIDCCLCASNIL